MSEPNEGPSTSNLDKQGMLYKNLNYISYAYYSSEGIFPFWESVYALIVGQLIIAYFAVGYDIGKILIDFAGIIFSVCWYRIVNLSWKYSEDRVNKIKKIERELKEIYENNGLNFHEGSPKPVQEKGKLDSTWFYRRLLPRLLISFWLVLLVLELSRCIQICPVYLL